MSAPTLEELAKMARTDLYEGRPGAAVDWMAQHARAQGQLVLADRALATIEWRERDVRVRTSSAFVANEDKVYIESMGPTGVETKNAEDMYAEATERVVFTENVLRVLTARFGRTAKAKIAPRQTATKEAPRFGSVNGGRR